MASASPISIIVPAYNQLGYCRQCVTSILANTSQPYKLILVDNGSTDGVSEYFDSVAQATVVHAQTNRGFAGGINLGLTHIPGHAVLLNSDTLVPRGWLARLEAALLSDDRIGMVGPMSNYVSGIQQINGPAFSTLEEIAAFSDKLAVEKQGRLHDVSRLVGFCMMIRDTVLRAVGGFDESFGLGNYEDDDYCLRVHQAGYRLCVAEDCFVFHYGSRTFLGMGVTGERWQALLAENQEKFLQKWQASAPDRSDQAQESLQLNCRARELFKQGRVTDALRVMKEAIEVFPWSEQNYNDLGAMLWKMGEHDRAFENFLRAVRLNPDYGEGRENLRDAARALGRLAELPDILGQG
jgi:hypothetical protein